jgi:ABC-2 type transport system ATP-binding protein
MEEVEYLCRNIHIMDSGQIIASGSQDDLIEIIEGERKIIIQLSGASPSFTESLTTIKGVDRVEADGHMVCIFTKNGKNIIRDALDKAMTQNIAVESLEVIKPNLESVFLHLTGKALRD